MKVTIPVQIHVDVKQGVTCKLTNYNLIWAHVNDTCSISHKAINFQCVRSVK